MSFIVEPAGGLDPLIIDFNAAVTPVSFVASSTLVSLVTRTSNVLSFSNGGSSSPPKGLYGPAGWYTFTVTVGTLAAPPYTGDLWESYIGSDAIHNNGPLYARFQDPGYPSNSPPIILSQFLNPDSYQNLTALQVPAQASPQLVAAEFVLTTLAAAAGFESCRLSICWICPP